MARDSFILYTGYWKPIQHLSNEQLGRLFRALYEYHTEGGVAEVADDIAIAYGFFVNQFQVDERKYQEIVEKRTRASRSRNQMTSSDITRHQMISNDVLNVNVNDNVNVNVNDNVCVNTQCDTHTQSFIEVLFFRNIKGAEKEVKRFEAFYNSTGWRLQGGEYIPPEKRMAKAENWKPLDSTPRFPEFFIEVWGKVYKGMPAEVKAEALTDRTKYTETEKEGRLVCSETVYNWAFGEGKEVFIKELANTLQMREKTLRIKHY